MGNRFLPVYHTVETRTIPLKWEFPLQGAKFKSFSSNPPFRRGDQAGKKNFRLYLDLFFPNAKSRFDNSMLFLDVCVIFVCLPLPMRYNVVFSPEAYSSMVSISTENKQLR